MKPIKDFVQDITKGKVHSYDVFRLLTALEEEGYYSFNSWELSYDGALRCDQWCIENCPNEYANIAGFIFFDNKDFAILMKLSVL